MSRTPISALALAALSLLASPGVQAADEPVWDAISPGGGWVGDFAVVPEDPATVYAAVGVSGLHRTLDGGETWAPANVGLEVNRRPGRLGAVAIDRSTDPPTLLAGAGGVFGTSTRGIFRSTDGAETWTTANEGLANADGLLPRVEEIVFDPQTPGAAWAATSGGVFRSVDGGATWSRTDEGLGPNSWTALAVDPETPGTVWIGTRDDIWKTTDAGESWEQRTTGLLDFFSAEVLMVDPTSSARVLLGTSDGVWETTDHGESWARAGLDGVDLEDLAIDPQDPQSSWAIPFSDPSLHRTSDGGVTWEEISLPTGRPLALELVEDVLWLGAQKGLFRSDDRGSTWTSRTGDLRGELIAQVVVDPRRPRRIYSVASSGELYRTDDGGSTWIDLSQSSGIGVLHLAIAPAEPDVLWAITSEGVGRSEDRGATWTHPVLDPMDFGELGGVTLYRILPHPEDADRLWAGTYGTLDFQIGGLFESNDRGATWTERYAFEEPEVNFQPESLVVDPSDPEHLYVGVHSRGREGAFNDGFILVSGDGGASWERTLDGIGFPEVTVDAAGHVYAQGSSVDVNPGVFVSRDAGATWTRKVRGLPETYTSFGLTAHPTLPGVVYASIGAEIYFTLDGGELWRPFGVEPDPERPILRRPTLYENAGGELDLLTGSDRGVLRLPRLTCVPGMPGCADGGRFDIAISWRDFAGNTGTATPVPFATPDSGLYTFFSPNNWELMVKVLDGCAINGHRWVFAAATTNVEYTLRVEDRETGEVAEYLNPLGTPAPALTDTEAFACDKARRGAPGEMSAAGAIAALSLPPAGLASTVGARTVPEKLSDVRTCRENATERCLLDGRYRVSIEWVDFDGNLGAGRVVPYGSRDSGTFWFFSPNNWEVLLKVLDGCAINGRRWVFSAATTNVAYTIQVEDTVSGEVREYGNALGERAAAVTDTDAFACP